MRYVLLGLAACLCMFAFLGGALAAPLVACADKRFPPKGKNDPLKD